MRHPPGTLRTCPGLYRVCLPLTKKLSLASTQNKSEAQSKLCLVPHKHQLLAVVKYDMKRPAGKKGMHKHHDFSAHLRHLCCYEICKYTHNRVSVFEIVITLPCRSQAWLAATMPCRLQLCTVLANSAVWVLII